jgi:hypothetical protein
MWNVISQVIGTGFKVMKTRSETKQMQALAEQKHYEKMVEGKIQYEVAKQNAMDSFGMKVTDLAIKKFKK